MNTRQYNNEDDDVSDEIASPYLKGVDVPKSGMRLTIKIVSLETFPSTPNDPPKRVILFYEIKKRLICNKTQLSTLAELFGPHPSEWKSQTVLLEPMPTMYNGKQVMTIAISAAPSQVPSAKSHGIPAETEPFFDGVTDADIPF